MTQYYCYRGKYSILYHFQASCMELASAAPTHLLDYFQLFQRILKLLDAKHFESGRASDGADRKCRLAIWRILQHGIRKRSDPTDQHTAAAPVPSVNISERPSVHRAGGRHLQLVAHSEEGVCE